MIRLHFKSLSSNDDETLGPARSFTLAGNFIRETASGQILARYLNHLWHVAEKMFARYDCPEPVYLHFEDAAGGCSPRYGPLAGLSVSDGAVHVQDQLVAKFIDPSVVWHDTQSDTYWPNMVLSSS